jgi:hypothetical protein
MLTGRGLRTSARVKRRALGHNCRSPMTLIDSIGGETSASSARPDGLLEDYDDHSAPGGVCSAWRLGLAQKDLLDVRSQSWFSPCSRDRRFENEAGHDSGPNCRFRHRQTAPDTMDEVPDGLRMAELVKIAPLARTVRSAQGIATLSHRRAISAGRVGRSVRMPG